MVWASPHLSATPCRRSCASVWYRKFTKIHSFFALGGSVRDRGGECPQRPGALHYLGTDKADRDRPRVQRQRVYLVSLRFRELARMFQIERLELWIPARG